MKGTDYARALVICGAIGALAACGGGSSPPSSVGEIPNAAQGASEVGAANWDLLYVSSSNGSKGAVTVYRFWEQLFFNTLTGFVEPRGECVNASGDVFVTDSSLGKIFEYAHGGSSAIATLSDAGYAPYACSVDAKTGRLAVANFQTKGGSAGNVAIYAHAAGKPIFFNANLSSHGPLTCGFDAAGNLLIATEYGTGSYETAVFAMLYFQTKAFKQIKISRIAQKQYQYVTNVQWDGKYWAVTDNGNVERYTIARDATVGYVGTTNLLDNSTAATQVWIWHTSVNKGPQANQALAAEAMGVNYWKYPAGGQPTGFIKSYQPYGVAISPKGT